jgi:hypothetical protein
MQQLQTVQPVALSNCADTDLFEFDEARATAHGSANIVRSA